MALYEISEDGLISIAPTRFDSENLAERRDIQRLLRDQIEALDDNLLVLAEEYGNWHDSLRRIDLLCLDRDAALVVVELKRSNDGGHMELQALRYAAMVSSMTFDQAVDALCTYSAQRGRTETADDARTRILDHLGWDEVDEDRFARVTRIMLASADFSRELTTSVLWLRERGIDIRCVRLAPHRLADGRVLLNIETIIPLAEAADFQTRIGAKKQAERVNDLERHDLRYRFWQGLLERARQRTNLHAGRSPNRQTWVSGSTGRPGYAIIYGLRQEDNHAQLWISNDAAGYAALEAQRAAIEAEFGAPLIWRAEPGQKGSAIEYMQSGGYRHPEDEWPAIQERMIDAMIRLDKVFRQRIQALPR